MTTADATTPEPTLASALDLAEQVGQALAARGWMVATAESCTGGLIGHLLTEIPGSSAYVAGGAITYSNDAKERVLAVPHELLLRVGAVSAEVAQAMAQGARALYAADVAVAVTGIAGPGGGLPHKPTGSVYLHVSGPDGWERGEYHVWPFDRSGNKLASAVRGLKMIIECGGGAGNR